MCGWFVGERLSYPDERTEAYDPDATYDSLCMAYIENDAPESGLPPLVCRMRRSFAAKPR